MQHATHVGPPLDAVELVRTLTAVMVNATLRYAYCRDAPFLEQLAERVPPWTRGGGVARQFRYEPSAYVPGPPKVARAVRDREIIERLVRARHVHADAEEPEQGLRVCHRGRHLRAAAARGRSQVRLRRTHARETGRAFAR